MKYVRLPEVLSKRLENGKKGMLAKYGVEYALNLPEFVKKSKATRLEKYGDENFVNSELAKKTKLKKYGSENYNNTEKFRNTCVKNLGVDNPSKLPEVINKTNKTKLKLFGKTMISPSAMRGLTERLKNKTIGYHSPVFKNTMLKKYGVAHCMQNSEISKRMADTTMDKFFEEMLSGDRLESKVIPLFSREQYVGTRNEYEILIPYKFKCNTCNSEFFAAIDGGGIPICKKCNPSSRSKPETEVFEFLKAHLPADCEIRQNDRQLIAPLELDFYIPSKNVAIEFDGIIWHSEGFGGKPRNYHISKTKAAHEKGVKLIHIFEPEWKLRQNIVKRKLLNLIGSREKILEDSSVAPSAEKSIFARKCNIIEITSAVCNEFLKKYHMQGSDKSLVKLGAIYENQLVAVMTFGKGRVAMGVKSAGENEYEMYRFAVGEHTIVGIGSKMLQHFIKTHTPTKITTFADIRYSGMTAFYEKIGFNFDGITQPNYWYFHQTDPYSLKHRFGFQKAALKKRLTSFEPVLSEWENMKKNGYDRIWDCGNLKYIWVNPAS
jgi:hypothetical protein